MKRFIIFFLCFILNALFSPAEVRFSDLDLSENNHLLFRAAVDSPVFGKYDTLFLADLGKDSLKQLTFFPERAALLEDGDILQIQNRFGVFRTDSDFKNVSPIDTFSSFTTHNRVESGKLMPIQIAPNGMFLLYMRQKSPAFGDLVLFDLKGQEEMVISRGIEINLKSPPAAWSPDSSFLIYSKADRLYYLSISQLKGKRLIAEQYRMIGKGKISSVQWGRGKNLYYISGSLVYQLDSRELFTRAIYSGYLKIGRISGKIPFDFDSNFDSFWIAPDGGKILLCKGGRNIFLYLLATKDFLSIGDTQSLPYLYLPRNTRIKRVLWTDSGTITILTEGIKKGISFTSIFRLPLADSGSISAFQPVGDDEVLDFILSPEEEKIALILNDRVVLKNYQSWAVVKEYTHPQPIHVLWPSEKELIIAGRHYTEHWNIRTGQSRLITISQPETFGFSEDSKRILMQTKLSNFIALPGDNNWEEISIFRCREAKIASDSFRVYLEPLVRSDFLNMVMIRNIKSFGTRSLLRLSEARYELFPVKDEPVDFLNFSHGSRIRQREVALVFNAINSIEGLTTILGVLQEYRVRCTFFVNGEVIRRYPDAVQEIAESGHEVGSLFYIHFNMTDSRFKLDKEFIKRGLDRNEDDYFKATGRELSLLWHAPYYFINYDIIEASKEMNYAYIGRDLDSLDWVTRDMSKTASDIYLPSARLVERIIEQKKPGSIIPIMVGVPQSFRADYLFQRLDLLIDGLVKLGYSIVPVTTLMENAK